MNRIDKRFAELRSAGRAGLIPFVTAGDPVPDAVVPLLHALVAAGADLIELGVPFSDPMADGPVIRHASERALSRGVGLHEILAWVRKFRDEDSTTPVVLMGYLNPLEIYGRAQFAADAVAAGVDGLLIVDCPLEEAETARVFRDAGLRQILLAAPTTSAERLNAMCEQARGFLYYVSFAGITGADKLQPRAVHTRVKEIKQRTDTPVAVGFGVRDAASATAIAEFADAVVIGSSLVETLSGATSVEEACSLATTFLAPIRAALDSSAT
ncbi:MAG TPA: tryptophan synthase subunit alpha [Rudaea sp.]|nr:tryptophan synthase subunit alpha [Rudaea sp.]